MAIMLAQRGRPVDMHTNTSFTLPDVSVDASSYAYVDAWKAPCVCSHLCFLVVDPSLHALGIELSQRQPAAILRHGGVHFLQRTENQEKVSCGPGGHVVVNAARKPANPFVTVVVVDQTSTPRDDRRSQTTNDKRAR